jgi:hypothetical protein
MDGGNTWLLLLEFFGFAGLTLALAFQQLYALKKLELKRLQKEREAAGESRQAGERGFAFPRESGAAHPPCS